MTNEIATATENAEALTAPGVILTRDGHRRYVPSTRVPTTSMWGAGVLVSITEDGWAEVQLDGETRRDKYPAEHVYVSGLRLSAVVEGIGA